MSRQRQFATDDEVAAIAFELDSRHHAEAWDAATGKGLWYTQIGGLQSPPETFMLDGKQHVLFTSNGSLFMFVLN